MISSIVATAQRSYNARNVALSSQCSRLFRRVPFISQCRQFEIFFSVVEIEPRQASTLLELGGLINVSMVYGKSCVGGSR